MRCTRDCSLEMPRKRRRVKLVKCGLPSGAALSLVRAVSGVDVDAEKSTAGKKRRVRFGLAQRFSHDSSTVCQFTVDQRPVPAVARSIRWTGLAGSRSGPSFQTRTLARGRRFRPVSRAPRVQALDDRRRERPSRRSRGRNPRANPRPPRPNPPRPNPARAPFRAAAPGDKISPQQSEAPSLNARHANAQEAQGRG